MNGSSGYEEAASQGLIAGINAALKVQNKEPLILRRSDAYIGVLIDDLVTKGIEEPYRIMTSKAEYRLLLRQDNADLRLTEIGYKVGSVTEERYEKFLERKTSIENEIARIKNLQITNKQEINKFLEEINSVPLRKPISLYELIKRPEVNYFMVASLDEDRPELPKHVQEQVNIMSKYEGYIDKQLEQVEQFRKMENKLLPNGFDYRNIKGLRTEAIQKLDKIKPLNLGQASRIAGVSPADISVLLIALEQYNRQSSKKED
jgi:tRNA uridine 5-carboxymethylaminomethyl modification enzyme